MKRTTYKDILEKLAAVGEMPGQELVRHVPRPHGNHKDFYPLAAMIHSGYIATEVTTEQGGEKIKGTFGFNTQETALALCQLSLPADESFELYGTSYKSFHDFQCTVFITGFGFLKLEEIYESEESKKQKRLDYMMAIIVAILAAVVSASLFHLFALERLA